MRCRPRYGFTLLELLAVMFIIALLAGMLLSALAAARQAARKAKAKADVGYIRAAWVQFFDDYSKFPSVYEGGDAVFDMDETAIDILRAANATENPQNRLYMDFRESTDYYCDPWGARNTVTGVYHVALDGDYDNKIELDGGAIVLYVSVAAWSDGPDRVSFTDDDVVSWKR